VTQEGEHKQASKRRGSQHWRPLFLDYLAASSNISESARRAGIDTGRVYKARRQDPVFAQAWLAALWEGYFYLEMEVVRRLREGDQKALEGERYDFANALRLLTAHRENAARAGAQQRNVSAAEIRASIDRKIEGIRQRLEREKAEQDQSAS
jgi:HD-like signal output (HDOD) protein